MSTFITAALIAVATMAAGCVALRAPPAAGGVLALVLGLCLGAVCFAALAVAVSAAIPSAETAGLVTLASYPPCALLPGVFSTTLALPAWLSGILSAFPVKALVGVLRAGYVPGHFPWASLAVLAGWALGGVLLARRFFRWQP